jgi:hypothetical protein
VGYRDDREALAARVEQLEGELDEARAEIARLRGERSSETPRANPLLGGPSRIRLERRLDVELPEAAYEELIAVLRAELGEVGRMDRIGRTLAWTSSGRNGRVVELTCEVRRGETRLRLHESLGQLAGGLFGGVVGGAGGGGLGAVIPIAIALGAAPALVPVLGAAWIASVYGATRWGYGRVAERRVEQLESLLARLTEVARDAAREAPSAARVRVAADEVAADEVAADEDAAVEHEEVEREDGEALEREAPSRADADRAERRRGS